MLQGVWGLSGTQVETSAGALQRSRASFDKGFSPGQRRITLLAGFLTLVIGGLAGGACTAPYAHRPNYRPAEMDALLATQAAKTDSGAAPDGLQAHTESQPIDLNRPITLEDCLTLALANSRGVRIADRRVLIARDRVDEAVASVRPTLGFDGRFEVRSNDMGSKNGAQGFAFGQRDVGSANLNLLVPIYDFGGSSAIKLALEQGAEAGEFQAQAARQATVLSVRLAYYRVLEARSIEQVVRDSQAVVDRQLAIARDFYAQGLVAKNDLLAVEVQQAQRQEETLRAVSNSAMAVATLNRLLGLEVSRPTQVADLATPPDWIDSYEKTLGLAIERRPELLGLKKQVELARTEYQAMHLRGRNPSLYAYGSWNGSTDDTLLNQQWLVGGVGLRFPLFDGGTTSAQLRRKTREIAEWIDLHDEKIDDTVLSVKQAWLQLRAVEQSLPVARKAIALARENLVVTMDRYKEGLATSAEVLVEEDRLARAQSGLSRAVYADWEAYAMLLNAVGADLPEAAARVLARDPSLPAEALDGGAPGSRKPEGVPHE